MIQTINNITYLTHFNQNTTISKYKSLESFVIISNLKVLLLLTLIYKYFFMTFIYSSLETGLVTK